MSGRVQGLWRRAAASESEKPSPDVSAASWKKEKEMSGHALISKAEFPTVCLSVCLLYLFLFYFDYLLLYLRIQRKSDLRTLQRFDVPDMCCVYLCSYVHVVSVISKKGRKSEWLCWTPSPGVIGGGFGSWLFCCKYTTRQKFGLTLWI